MTLPTDVREGIAFFETKPNDMDDDVTLVLLHGLGNSLDFWTAIAPALGAVNHTIALDIPGFGRSRLPLRDFTLDRVCENVLSFLRECGCKRAILVAHSMGAFLALKLASTDPGVFQRIMLVDGTLGRAADAIKHPSRALKEPRLGFSVLSQFVGGVIPVRRRLAHLIGRSRLVRQLTLWPYVASPGELDGKLVSDALSHNGGITVVKVLKEARRIDYVDLLKGVVQPVDLIWGASDALLDRRDVEQAQALMNIERTLEIHGCGHWPMIEAPSALIDFVLGRRESDP